MRRKDREITDFNEIIVIMQKCDTCRLAVNDGDYPCIAPLNFGLDVQDNRVYLCFHSALEGRKVDLFRKNNKVAYEMDCGHQIIMFDEPMSCTMGYESVMGHGTIKFLPEEESLTCSRS